MLRDRVRNGDNVDGIDRVGDALAVNDHDHLGVKSDEIRMRHGELAPVGEMQAERMKTVVQPLADLTDNHDAKLGRLPAPFNVVVRLRLVLGTGPRFAAAPPTPGCFGFTNAAAGSELLRAWTARAFRLVESMGPDASLRRT